MRAPLAPNNKRKASKGLAQADFSPSLIVDCKKSLPEVPGQQFSADCGFEREDIFGCVSGNGLPPTMRESSDTDDSKARVSCRYR